MRDLIILGTGVHAAEMVEIIAQLNADAPTWNLLGQAVDGPLQGEQLVTVSHRNDFWFAWASFFPDAPVYGADES